MMRGGAVATQPPGFDIRQHPFPSAFRIAGHNRIKMVRRLIGAQRRVVAAADHDFSPRSELVRDLISPRRQRGHERDPDQIAFRFKIKRLDVFVQDPHRMIARGQRRHRCQWQHAEPQHGPFRDDRVRPRHANAIAGGKDQ